jgi:hypothetical protein
MSLLPDPFSEVLGAREVRRTLIWLSNAGGSHRAGGHCWSPSPPFLLGFCLLPYCHPTERPPWAAHECLWRGTFDLCVHIVKVEARRINCITVLSSQGWGASPPVLWGNRMSLGFVLPWGAPAAGCRSVLKAYQAVVALWGLWPWGLLEAGMVTDWRSPQVQPALVWPFGLLSCWIAAMGLSPRPFHPTGQKPSGNGLLGFECPWEP